MKWVRMADGKVAEVIDFNPEGKFHPAIVWEEAPDSVEPNMVKNEQGEFEHASE